MSLTENTEWRQENSINTKMLAKNKRGLGWGGGSMCLFVSFIQKQPPNLCVFHGRFNLQENHLKLLGTEDKFCQTMIKLNLINLVFH